VPVKSAELSISSDPPAADRGRGLTPCALRWAKFKNHATENNCGSGTVRRSEFAKTKTRATELASDDGVYCCDSDCCVPNYFSDALLKRRNRVSVFTLRACELSHLRRVFDSSSTIGMAINVTVQPVHAVRKLEDANTCAQTGLL